MYKCFITSDCTHTREYEVTTTSAYKAAMELGWCEFGETVEIRNKSGKLISACHVNQTRDGYVRMSKRDVDFANAIEARYSVG